MSRRIAKPASKGAIDQPDQSEASSGDAGQKVASEVENQQDNVSQVSTRDMETSTTPISSSPIYSTAEGGYESIATGNDPAEDIDTCQSTVVPTIAGCRADGYQIGDGTAQNDEMELIVVHHTLVQNIGTSTDPTTWNFIDVAERAVECVNQAVCIGSRGNPRERRDVGTSTPGFALEEPVDVDTVGSIPSALCGSLAAGTLVRRGTTAGEATDLVSCRNDPTRNSSLQDSVGDRSSPLVCRGRHKHRVQGNRRFMKFSHKSGKSGESRRTVGSNEGSPSRSNHGRCHRHQNGAYRRTARGFGDDISDSTGKKAGGKRDDDVAPGTSNRRRIAAEENDGAREIFPSPGGVERAETNTPDTAGPSTSRLTATVDPCVMETAFMGSNLRSVYSSANLAFLQEEDSCFENGDQPPEKLPKLDGAERRRENECVDSSLNDDEAGRGEDGNEDGAESDDGNESPARDPLKDYHTNRRPETEGQWEAIERQLEVRRQHSVASCQPHLEERTEVSERDSPRVRPDPTLASDEEVQSADRPALDERRSPCTALASDKEPASGRRIRSRSRHRETGLAPSCEPSSSGVNFQKRRQPSPSMQSSVDTQPRRHDRTSPGEQPERPGRTASGVNFPKRRRPSPSTRPSLDTQPSRHVRRSSGEQPESPRRTPSSPQTSSQTQPSSCIKSRRRRRRTRSGGQARRLGRQSSSSLISSRARLLPQARRQPCAHAPTRGRKTPPCAEPSSYAIPPPCASTSLCARSPRNSRSWTSDPQRPPPREQSPPCGPSSALSCTEIDVLRCASADIRADCSSCSSCPSNASSTCRTSSSSSGGSGSGSSRRVRLKRARRRPLRRGNALREIRRLRDSTEPLLPLAPFLRVVREIIYRQTPQYLRNCLRVQRAAVMALREAVEMYLVQLFEDSTLCTAHGNRVTLQNKDLRLVRRLRGPEI